MQPRWFILQDNNILWGAYGVLFIGVTLVATSFYQLGFTGTFFGMIHPLLHSFLPVNNNVYSHHLVLLHMLHNACKTMFITFEIICDFFYSRWLFWHFISSKSAKISLQYTHESNVRWNDTRLFFHSCSVSMQINKYWLRYFFLHVKQVIFYSGIFCIFDRQCSQAGLFLSLVMAVVFHIALRYEG